MKLGLSDGYKLIKILDDERPGSIADLKRINNEISDADKELAKSLHQFQKCVSEALSCLDGSHEALMEKLMYLRIHAIQIGESFDEFVDTFDKVLKGFSENLKK